MTASWVKIESTLIANRDLLAQGSLPISDIIGVLQSIENVNVLVSMWKFLKEVYQSGMTASTVAMIDNDVKRKILVSFSHI